MKKKNTQALRKASHCRKSLKDKFDIKDSHENDNNIIQNPRTKAMKKYVAYYFLTVVSLAWCVVGVPVGWWCV